VSIPNFQDCMRPILEFLVNGQEKSRRQMFDSLAEYFKLSDTELSELLPSGIGTRFEDRASWARTYLYKARLLDIPRRGYSKITQRGTDALNSNENINIAYLERFKEFNEYYHPKVKDRGSNDKDLSPETTKSPLEIFELGYEKIQSDVAQELLDAILQCSSSFFERLVVDLLLAMGYGGSRREAATVTKKSGDGGIDGIIKEDKLGLSSIYIQAKRWKGQVGRPEVQTFAGALQEHYAEKGVLITTGYFTQEATRSVQKIKNKIILIDGAKLTELMMEHGVGVSAVKSFEIKKVNLSYFSEE
jgi:restriction system protein